MSGGGRGGFSLIEVLISLVIFSGVILGLAGLSFQVAKRSTRSTDQAFIMTNMLGEVERLSVLHFDSLPGAAGCRTNSSGPVFLYRCVDVYILGPRLDSIRIIAWTSIAGGTRDTIGFRRAKERRPVPLR